MQIILPLFLFSLAQATTAQHARRQDPPPTADEPCTVFGSYLCKANSLYQCSYEADLTLGYRFLWNCGTDVCTVSPAFTGCAPGPPTTTTSSTTTHTSTTSKTTTTTSATSTTTTGPICQFGAWRCVGETLEQCGYLAGGVLDWRWISQCPLNQFCNANGPNGFVGCQLTPP
ncbi:hypothetical protein HDU98_008039 [Podochytrium sp. JEL0797]|nr:hypothetical protein HDU98_008039 [Podochytrium sp. JEL0797]